MDVGEGLTTGAADFVGFALGSALVAGEALTPTDGIGVAEESEVGNCVTGDSAVEIGFWVTRTSGARGMFSPASFTLLSGERSRDSRMNPETIVTKAARLTPVANKRLRSAGLTRNFMVKTPGWAPQGKILRH